MAYHIVCHLSPNGWAFLERSNQSVPNLFFHIIIESSKKEIQPEENYPDWTKPIFPYHHWFIQAGDTTWNEVGGHVGTPCLHQLPEMEKPIHIMWWLLICVFEPCDCFLKPHTAHVPIEAEGGSSTNSNIVLWPPIYLTSVYFVASNHQPHPQSIDEVMLWHMITPLRKAPVYSWEHDSLNIVHRK